MQLRTHLELIVQSSPNLTHLEIEVYPPKNVFVDMFEVAIPSLLKLESLETLSFPRRWLSARIVQSLRTLPRLERLLIWDVRGRWNLSFTLKTERPRPSNPVVETVSLNALHTSNDGFVYPLILRDTLVHECDLRSFSVTFRPKEKINTVPLNQLPLVFPHLRVLRLLTALRLEDPHTLNELSPLMALRGLEEIAIRHTLLSDSDFKRLLASWPRLRILYLTGPPAGWFLSKHYDGDYSVMWKAELPQLTLTCLESLASSHPRLEYLGISFSACNTTNLPNTPLCFTNLKCVHLFRSLINYMYPGFDPDVAALHLSKTFPPTVDVRCTPDFAHQAGCAEPSEKEGGCDDAYGQFIGRFECALRNYVRGRATQQANLSSSAA
jgi:hypothetical protein